MVLWECPSHPNISMYCHELVLYKVHTLHPTMQMTELIFFGNEPFDKREFNRNGIKYCKESKKCRWQILYQDCRRCEFLSKGCLCRDVCSVFM